MSGLMFTRTEIVEALAEGGLRARVETAAHPRTRKDNDGISAVHRHNIQSPAFYLRF